MRKITCILISLFSIASIQAQHCRWDGDQIIMVKINHPDALEDKFRIELLNSSGKPFMVSKGTANKTDSIALEFWKNAPEGTKFDYRNPQSVYFPFVKSEYYILTDAPYRAKSLKARLTYMGKKNKKYKPVIVDLPENALLQLCTENARLWAGNVQPIVLEFK